ncbi:hypothetical protein Ga0100230_024450 [Opitutaceae bacterium TAV3]|nr:hypothetical protein Ga0100230_024450 [Opitutaceae bacterium TAV3]
MSAAFDIIPACISEFRVADRATSGWMLLIPLWGNGTGKEVRVLRLSPVTLEFPPVTRPAAWTPPPPPPPPAMRPRIASTASRPTPFPISRVD